MLTTTGLHYDLIGPRDGRVVCLVHSLAADTGMWREQMLPLLNAGYSVLRLDLPGHGGSAARAGAYTMAGLAQDVVAVLDAAHVATVDYVGLSLGGMVGQALALAHPARLRSVMICDALPQKMMRILFHGSVLPQMLVDFDVLSQIKLQLRMQTGVLLPLFLLEYCIPGQHLIGDRIKDYQCS